MSLVVDASLTLSWYFEDERTPESEAVLHQVVTDSALVPPLWRLEVANGFQMAIRRKRIAAGFRDRALLHLAALPIREDSECRKFEWTTTVELADRFGLTIYDAAYVELAHRRLVPLASLDKKMRAAGRALDLATLGAEP